MQYTFLSRFTPSLMTPDTLEALFVQREKLAQSLVERLRESIQTSNKHYMLLIGPRGIGKTHLVALVYHRLQAMDDLCDQMRVAWLREEEWGITSFLDLLLRILRALQEQYDDTDLDERIEALFGRDAEEATRAAADLLTDYVGDRTLVVMLENLDDIFDGLGDEGQQQWRAYLQNHSNTAVLATAQSLFNGVSLRTSPFYGFFDVRHLPQFTLDDAVNLLHNVAEHEGDDDLAAFLETPTGRARVRAVHHLAGGNPRVYVIFSQFLSAEALDALVEPFMQMLDELTPYYQARMQWLSPQQRKIVEFLAERRGAVPVKTIAERNFMTHQTASGQLRSLRDSGYVQARKVGRESHYELREPLLRLVIEVKKYRSAPIRLLVDFLRLWYTRTDLQQRMAVLGPEAAMERTYVQEALATMETETSSMVVKSCQRDFDRHYEAGAYEQALRVANELVEVRGNAIDWAIRGCTLGDMDRHEEALESYEHAIGIEPDFAEVWNDYGAALWRLDRHEEALSSFDRAIQLSPHLAIAWHNRGVALGRLNQHEEALDSFNQILESSPEDAHVWNQRGVALANLGRFEEALESYKRAIGTAKASYQAYFNRADMHFRLGQWREARGALTDALTRFSKEDPDILAIQSAHALFGLLTRERREVVREIRKVLALFAERELVAILTKTIILLLPALLKKPDAEARRWLEAWRAAAEEHEALELPVRLFEAAVRYRETEDERALLALPAEERDIVKQILRLDDDEQEEAPSIKQ
jgi:tetratricopeptide (TPR) repeat protein